MADDDGDTITIVDDLDEEMLTIADPDTEVESIGTIQYEGTYFFFGVQRPMVMEPRCHVCQLSRDFPIARLEIDMNLAQGWSARSVYASLDEPLKDRCTHGGVNRHRAHVPVVSLEEREKYEAPIRARLKATSDTVVEHDVARRTVLAMEMDRYRTALEHNPTDIPNRAEITRLMRVSQREDDRDFEMMRRYTAQARETLRAFATLTLGVMSEMPEVAQIIRDGLRANPLLDSYFRGLREEAIEAQSRPALSSSSDSE